MRTAKQRRRCGVRRVGAWGVTAQSIGIEFLDTTIGGFETGRAMCTKRGLTLHLKQATQYWHADNAHKCTILVCA